MNLGPVALSLIEHANTIITEYDAAGYELTLRQLYYQFVSRDLFPASWADSSTGSTNNERSYKKLGDIVSNARLCGLIDWSSITDRTRNIRRRPEWRHPSDIIAASARQFHMDLWKGQSSRPEVWVEKDALVDVFSVTCNTHGCSYFSCRGYTSLSEIWSAAQRLGDIIRDGQTAIILHFGDHDPSGIDMTRDVEDRIRLFLTKDLGPRRFSDSDFEVRRIALNHDQIRQYKPPPNPAKATDSRHASYAAKYGTSSWELDALDPRTLSTLAEKHITSCIDNRKGWKLSLEEEEEHRSTLSWISSNYDDIAKREHD
jgi:hypothetical protein